MKNKGRVNPFFRIFLILSLLILAAIVGGIFIFYYVFAIPEPQGLSLASWPKTFTENFSFWLKYEKGEISVKESGINRLDEYGLWIQVIDEQGRQVYAHKKPEGYPTDYRANELLELETDNFAYYENGYTGFTGKFQESQKTWSYIIGFPYRVGKYMLYYNGEHMGKLSFVANVTILIVLGVLIILAIGYGFWISRKLGVITGGIEKISLRAFKPLKERGMFRDIYAALNTMDKDIKSSDRLKEETDRTRREWIANITHDLKTPLSPVKGYGELLTENRIPKTESVQEYGRVILKNANYIEKLIDDLKLTYQLDSGGAPFNPQEVAISRFLKELTIELVNDPAFSGRDIGFESSIPEVSVQLDPHLLRRGVQNLIINALTHNPPDTKITVSVDLLGQENVCISVSDNGIGMSEEEQKEVFSRYFRAASTGERPEGSGLGLAIARQIIVLHGGSITVKSKKGEGTTFNVTLSLR